MKKELTVITLPSTGLYASDIEEDLRYEFPHISRLNVTEGNGVIFVAWIARKYRKSQVEKFLRQLQEKAKESA